jgi:hypothetical protein
MAALSLFSNSLRNDCKPRIRITRISSHKERARRNAYYAKNSDARPGNQNTFRIAFFLVESMTKSAQESSGLDQ